MTDQLRAFEEKLADVPGNRALFDELRAQLWEEGDWRGVHRLYEAAQTGDSKVERAEFAAELADFCEKLEPGPEKGRIYLFLGDYFHRQLRNHEEGMTAYERAFAAHPDDDTARERVAEIYRKRRDWEQLLKVLQMEKEAAKDPAVRGGSLRRMAQVFGEGLQRFDEALKTLDEMESLGRTEPFGAQLRVLYEQELTVEDGILEALVRAEEAINQGDEKLAAVALLEAAQLEYDRYGGSREEALDLARQARMQDPDNEEVELFVAVVSDELAEHRGAEAAESNGEEVHAANVSSAQSETGSVVPEEERDADAGATEARTVEGFYEGLVDFDGSLDEARDLLEKNRSHLGALKALRADLLDKGDNVGLVELLEGSVRYLRKRDGEWEVMTELANLYWLDLGDDEKAEYYFKRLKSLDEEHEDVYKFYEAYHESTGDWRKLYALISSRLEQVKDREDHRELTERLAEIAAGELNSPEKAIGAWKGFLTIYPEDQEARRILRLLYEENGKWNALVQMLKEEIREREESEEDTTFQQIELLEEMAHVYRNHLNLDTMVMNIMAQILALDPDHLPAFAELRELYEKNRRFNDLVGLLAIRAERAIEGGERGLAVGLLLEVADFWEHQLNNQTQALPFLERIAEVSPEDVDVRKRLREIYEARRDFRSLFDLRLGEVSLLGSEEQIEELEALREMALEKLRDPAREVRVLETLLEVRGDDLRALNELEDAHRRLENWPEVINVLQRRATLVDEGERVEALEQAAVLVAEYLHDADQAARLWRAILAEDRDHRRGFDELSRYLTDQGDFDGLEALYLKAKRAEELFEYFGKLAASGVEPAGLERRRVRIGSEELQSSQLVIEALENLTLLVDSPDQVLKELIPWYEQTGAIDQEIEARRSLLDRLEGEARFEGLLTLATLEEERECFDVALGWVMKALESKPDAKSVFERAESLAQRVGMLDILADQVLELATGQDDGFVERDLREEVARIYHRKLENFERAIEVYEILRGLDGERLDYLQVLDELYDRTEAAEARIDVLRAQIDLLNSMGASESELVDPLSKISDVQRASLGEVGAAQDTYRQILDHQPDHLGAIRGLKEICREQERWTDVMDYLLREIPLAHYESPQAVWSAKMELARLFHHQLGDLIEALRYYGEILGENAEHEEAREAVQRLLSEDSIARDASMMLELIYRDRQQAGPLAEALEARLRVCTDPFEEQEILDELIPLYSEELEDTAQAFKHARRLFEIDPERDEIWLRFEQLGAQLNEWELIEEMFSRESPLAGRESPMRFDLLRHLAAIREHRLQKTEEALRAWERLHEYDPLDVQTLEALERLYRKTGDIEGLVRALRARALLVDLDEDRVNLLVEAGHLLSESLGDDVLATEVYQEVMGLQSGHEDAVDPLVRLLKGQNRWHDLDALLREQSDSTLDPDRRRQHLKLLARLRYEQLMDRGGAVAILCALLEDDPGDDEVLVFSREVDQELAKQGDLDLRLELGRTLEPIYRIRGEYDLLDNTLMVRLEAAQNEFEKLELLDELVELRQKKLSTPSRAFDAQASTVLLQPNSEERRKKLLELANGTGRLEEAIKVLEDAAEEADSFVALEIWKSLGRLSAQRLGNTERAVGYFERARQIDEADVQLLEKLELLFEGLGDSERLCENLIVQAQFAAPEQRMILLRRIATLQEKVLRRPQEAIDTHRQILAMEPDDLTAMNSLEGLFVAESQPFELIDLWSQKVNLLDSQASRIGVYRRWARVAEEELADIDQAVSIYWRVLEEEPDDGEALAELDRLLEQEVRWTDWVEVARRRIAQASTVGDDERVESLQLRLGRALVKELFEVQEGIRVYREILGHSPQQSEAVEALETIATDESWIDVVAPDLERIYRHQCRWEDLLDLYERRRNLAVDPMQKASLFFKAGEIYRDELEKPEEAMRTFGQAWMLALERRQYKESLIELGIDARRFELLVELLNEVLTVVVNPDLSRELHHRLATIWHDVLESPAEAETHLREVLVLEPGEREAFEELRSLLANQERWYDLIELLEARHDMVIGESSKEAVGLLLEIADLQAEELGDSFGAVETLQRLRAVNPRHGGALERLERWLREQERWEDLAQFYEEKISLAQVPSDVLKAEMALAEVCRGPLHQTERAVELYGRALSIDAGHKEAIACLEDIFAEQGDCRALVAALLEPVYRTTRERVKLAPVLEARALGSDDRAMRHQLLRELVDLLQEIDQPRWQWRTLARHFMESPGEADIRERLWRQTARGHGWRQLIEVYDATLQENFDIDDGLRAQLQLERARLFADRLNDLAAGRQAAEEALRMNPELEETIDLMERILQREKAWVELGDFYRGRADYAADEDTKLYWYERLAALTEDVLEDVDGTVDVYAQLLELAPGRETYRAAMERLLSSVGRWYDLADIYRQRIAGAFDPEVVTSNRFALAHLLETELNAPQEAVHLYQEILTDDPGNSEAMRGLEGVRRELARRDEIWEDLRRQVIETLLANYEEARAWQRIDDLLDEQVELIVDRDERTQMLVQKAELLLRSSSDFADQAHALTTLAQAHSLAPQDRAIEARLEELANAMDAWERVIPIYLRALGKTDDVDRQGHILTAIAKVYEHQMDDKESAIAAYQQSVEISVESSEALEKLQELYGQMEKWEPLVAILERRLEVIADDEQKRSLRKRIGRIYDDILRDPNRAIPLYEVMRQEEPEELAHVVILQRLYEETERFEDLEGLLIEKLQLLSSESLRAAALKRLGEIRCVHLGRLEDSIDCFHEVLAVDADVEVMDYLSEIYRRLQRWPELIEMMRSRVGYLDAASAAELEVEMGHVYWKELHDVEAAFDAYQSALVHAPYDEGARGVLAAIIDEPAVRHRAVELLVDLYSNTEEWDRLEQVYLQGIEVSSDDPEYLADLYLSLARLQEGVFGYRSKAFETLLSALDHVVEDDRIRAEAERLAVETVAPKRLIARYEEVLEEGIENTEVRRAMLLMVGAGYVDAFDDLRAAEPYFLEILDLDEFDAEALEWLERIYGEQQKYAELAEVFEKELLVRTGEEALTTRFQLAYLVELDQEDHARAYDLYREVLLEEPGHEGAVEGLERLCAINELRDGIFELLEPTYRQAGAWTKLVRLYELHLEIRESPWERAAAYREMGRIELDELQEVEKAFQYWCQTLISDPQDGEVQERLEMIAVQKGWLDKLVQVYRDIVMDLEDPVRRLSLAEKGARWAMEDLGDRGMTAALYRVVLEIEPEHGVALETLERLAREESDLASLEAVLTARLSSAFDSDTQRELYQELVTVRIQLEAWTHAIEALEELQLLDGEEMERLEVLVDLYGRVEGYEKQVQTLERLLPYREEEAEIFSLWAEMGLLAITKMENPTLARTYLEQAMRYQAQNRDVLRALETVYEALEEREALLEVLSAELTLEEDDEERVRLFIRRAQLNYEVQKDVDGAIRDYQAAIAIRDDHPDVIAALGDLYRSEERWENLIELRSAQARRATDRSVASMHWLQVAVIAEEELGAWERAAEFAMEALESDESNREAVDRLEAIQRARKDWPAVIGILEFRLAPARKEERLSLLMEIARIQEGEMRAPEQAAQTYEVLRREFPREGAFVAKLEELYTAGANGEALHELYQSEALQAQGAPARIALYLKMGEVARRFLHDSDRRIDALEKARREGGDGELSVVEPLLDAYIEGGQYGQAEPLLAAVIDTLQQERRLKEAVRFYHLRGKLAEEQGRLEVACEAYDEAHRIDATYVPNLLSLGRLAIRMNDWARAKKTFQILLLHQMNIRNSEDKVQVYYYLGMVRQREGDERGARDMYKRALRVDANHAESQAALESLG